MTGFDEELRHLRTLRSELECELGNPAEMRAERDGLERAFTQSAREETKVRDELLEHELRTPGTWVREAFGERPDELAARETWEAGVRRVALYRAEYEISDSSDALGPRPERREQRHDWNGARQAIERAGRQLGHDLGVDRGMDLDIGF